MDPLKIEQAVFAHRVGSDQFLLLEGEQLHVLVPSMDQLPKVVQCRCLVLETLFKICLSKSCFLFLSCTGDMCVSKNRVLVSGWT